MKVNGLGSFIDGGKRIAEELVKFQRFEGIEGKENQWLHSPRSQAPAWERLFPAKLCLPAPFLCDFASWREVNFFGTKCPSAVSPDPRPPSLRVKLLVPIFCRRAGKRSASRLRYFGQA